MTNVTGIIRCVCGHKFVVESTLFKTKGRCPKPACNKLIDASYATTEEA